MRDAFDVIGSGQHHRQHAQLVGLRDLGAAAFHAVALLLGGDVYREQRDDRAVLGLEVRQDQLGEASHRLCPFGPWAAAVADHVDQRVHLGVLGLEQGEQPGGAGRSGGEQRPVELVLLGVVTQQVIGDQSQMVFDDPLLLRRHRSAV